MTFSSLVQFPTPQGLLRYRFGLTLVIGNRIAEVTFRYLVQPFVEDYLERLQDLHGAIERAIEGLPQAALDWVPGPDMNSLAHALEHTALHLGHIQITRQLWEQRQEV